MSTVVRLVQGSAEWHEHRRKHRNASETPIVMGVSPWQTPYQLWQEKLGLATPQINAAMLRGTELEPAARAAYEQLSGHVMQPLVLVEGDYSASLDGLTLGGDRLLEIKCPLKGRESTLWKTVEDGRLPVHYELQVQHQLMVTNAAIADFYVFDGAEGMLLEVEPQPDVWHAVRSTWDAFAQYITKQEAPPLSERDVRVRDDPEWLAAAAAYRELRAAYDELNSKCEEAKKRLVSMASHAKEGGGGVSVTRYWKRGAIDYKRVPALADLDLEPYRTSPREETRVVLGG